MTELAAVSTHIFSILTLFLLAFSILCIYSLSKKNTSSDKFIRLVGPYARIGTFLLALAAMLGSLFYSEIIGFKPCTLCVVQRFFMYPQVVTLGAAMLFKKFKVLIITIILSILGGVSALYHAYAGIFGSSLLACVTTGGSCSKVYFLEWGFISIPFMAFTVFLTLIMLELVNRKYKKRDDQV